MFIRLRHGPPFTFWRSQAIRIGNRIYWAIKLIPGVPFYHIIWNGDILR